MTSSDHPNITPGRQADREVADKRAMGPAGGLPGVVAANLRSIRDARGWTQLDLCSQLEPLLGRPVSQAQLSAWETRRTQARIEHLAAFAAALNVPIIELLRFPAGTALPALVDPACDVALAEATVDQLLGELRRRLETNSHSR